MSKAKKILLGLFTIWPIIYMFLFFALAISMIFTVDSSSNQIPPALLLIFPLHLLTMLLIVILMIIYIRDVFKSGHIAQDKKTLWAVVLFLGNMIAMPIYWYLHIWKEPK